MSSLLHMSSQYGELRPTNGWDQLASLGHLSKFQRVSRHLGFVTAPTSPNGGQPNFARCLVVSWAGTLLYTFWGLLPLDGILPGEKIQLCVQVLRSPILAALMHGTPAVGVSQTLRCGTRNGITERSFRSSSFSTQGDPHSRRFQKSTVHLCIVPFTRGRSQHVSVCRSRLDQWLHRNSRPTFDFSDNDYPAGAFDDKL